MPWLQREGSGLIHGDTAFQGMVFLIQADLGADLTFIFAVFGLIDQGDLNAKTCTDDLRTQVSVTGGALFAALVSAVLAPMVAKRLRTDGARPPTWLFAVAVGVCAVIAVAGIALGRHRIWAVGGA